MRSQPLLFICFPAILAAILYIGLHYPTEALVTEVMAKAETTRERVLRLDEAVKRAEAKAKIDCDGTSAESVRCIKSSSAKATAIAAATSARTEQVGLRAALQAEANQILALLAAQLALVAAIAWAITRYLAGKPNPKAPFYVLRRSALAVIGLLVVIAGLSALAGLDPWSQALVTAATTRLSAEGIAEPTLRYLLTGASFGFSLFAGVLAAVSVAAALLAVTYDPDVKSAAMIDDDLLRATLPRRKALLQGLLGLATLCFLVTMGLVARLGDFSLAVIPATGSDATRKILDSLSNSVEMYWGIGLSLLLAAIFIPPAAYLLEKDPESTRTNMGFIDILGDDTFKKVLAVLFIAAPATFPLLAKWIG
ncbi:hypothetical protein [Mesorhizobium australicum]|uniref:Uncharacterized protein n=1 Tax=Mesorhizobium australicum TaxID=536018 RepID=A0A1X7PFH7_9HYPH|nr:hypothetical protein [Mesorhizobium australicum]SMH49250.1 hypothetical protein SAMN02982922_3888 [Mesorhizobium australicum]